MDISKIFFSVTVATLATASLGSGFALYQPSATAHAMGGALVGKAMDASANFVNPATLTDLTNIQVTAGFVSEHPRGSVEVSRDGGPYREFSMDPGVFWLPHFQLAVPLPLDFTFGLGFQPDYGLGTQYDDFWDMNFSATDTKIQSVVLTPNLAYRVTEDWTLAVGLRWIYFEFEQYSIPMVPNSPANTIELGRFGNRLRGDNGFKDFGWQVGTKYDITETFSVGLVYKSWIDVNVDGKTSNELVDVKVPAAASSLASAAYNRTGYAAADITLPQSVTAGCNWDVFPTWHLGAAISWTQWSEFDNLHFALQGGDKDTRLNWRDTWRGSIGSCWDFADDWKWMASYVYDMDSTQPSQESVMLPPADRHILGTGFSWNCFAGLELTLSYACIFMEGGDMATNDPIGRRYRLRTCRGFCHAAGFSVTYRF